MLQPTAKQLTYQLMHIISPISWVTYVHVHAHNRTIACVPLKRATIEVLGKTKLNTVTWFFSLLKRFSIGKAPLFRFWCSPTTFIIYVRSSFKLNDKISPWLKFIFTLWPLRGSALDQRADRLLWDHETCLKWSVVETASYSRDTWFLPDDTCH